VLAAAQWSAKAGATCMPRLWQLSTHPGSPSPPAAALQQLQEQHGLPRQQQDMQPLRFPALQKLAFNGPPSVGAEPGALLPGAAQQPALLQALALASRAPVLEELDLRQL
jgi:hypothetical protein